MVVVAAAVVSFLCLRKGIEKEKKGRKWGGCVLGGKVVQRGMNLLWSQGWMGTRQHRLSHSLSIKQQRHNKIQNSIAKSKMHRQTGRTDSTLR